MVGGQDVDFGSRLDSRSFEGAFEDKGISRAELGSTVAGKHLFSGYDLPL